MTSKEIVDMGNELAKDMGRRIVCKKEFDVHNSQLATVIGWCISNIDTKATPRYTVQYEDSYIDNIKVSDIENGDFEFFD